MAKYPYSKRQLEDAHKITYIAREYPMEEGRETMYQLSQFFLMPMMESNAAIRVAEEMGWLFVDNKTSEYKVEGVPEKWEFGTECENLIADIKFTLKWLADDNTDLGENEFSNWMEGYMMHDRVVALRYLLETKDMAMYTIFNTIDIPNEPSKKKKGKGAKTTYTKSKERYTFYTRFADLELKRGQNQFPDKSRISFE